MYLAYIDSNSLKMTTHRELESIGGGKLTIEAGDDDSKVDVEAPERDRLRERGENINKKI
jgi:hypothetical protein